MTVDREGFTTVDYRQDGALGFMDDVRDREIDMNLEQASDLGAAPS